MLLPRAHLPRTPPPADRSRPATEDSLAGGGEAGHDRHIHSDLYVVVVLLGLPAAAGFGVAVAVATLFGRKGAAVAVAVLPISFAVALWLAYAVVFKPDEGCSVECWGGVLYGVWWFVATVGAYAGLAVALLAQLVRER